jgi:hypothetical protein
MSRGFREIPSSSVESETNCRLPTVPLFLRQSFTARRFTSYIPTGKRGIMMRRAQTCRMGCPRPVASMLPRPVPPEVLRRHAGRVAIRTGRRRRDARPIVAVGDADRELAVQ